MSRVIRGRARPAVDAGRQPMADVTNENTLAGWVQRKAIDTVRRKTFVYELDQGLLTEEEITKFTELNVGVIEQTVLGLLSEIELNKTTYGERFDSALDRAVRDNDIAFDFQRWNDDFNEKLDDFQAYEVVFFRNRTTAFTLPKPCPNCGQKKLVAEGQVFTRSADEAASQFATCKNCSSRFRLQSVM